MQNSETQEQITRRLSRLACLAALGMAFTVALPQAAHADRITVPPVPPDLEAPVNTRVFFVGHGVGTQNYVCLPSGSSVAWTLFTPQATLFSDSGQQVTTHFFSPNPDEGGIIRATWEDSHDTSTVWAQLTQPSTDARFVTPGAIPWLLLHVVGRQEGPTGGGKLLRTSDIQRLNTVGGSAPSTGCSQAKEIGSKAFVPYTADYFFYENIKPRTYDGNGSVTP
jgi:uncharacterized protein DUF3455